MSKEMRGRKRWRKLGGNFVRGKGRRGGKEGNEEKENKEEEEEMKKRTN